MLPEVKDSSAKFGDSDPSLFGGAIAISGIAGDQQAATIGQACFAPGMIKSTYGTGCFALLNTGTTPVASKNKLLTTIAYQLERQTHLRARRLDLRRRLRRCNGCATGSASSSRPPRPARSPTNPIPCRASIWCRPSSASARPTGIPRPRRAVRPHPQHRPRRTRARRARKRLLPDLRSSRGDARRLAGREGRQRAPRRRRHDRLRLDHAAPRRSARRARSIAR